MTDTETIFELYERAYSLLDDLTPISADCGKLCKKRCCKGDKDYGMLLFPYEDLFLDGQQRMLKITEKKRISGSDVSFAVCKGKCRREWRPLSCRIYPFAPVMVENGLRIIADPRAAYICPLLDEGARQYISTEFLQAVKQAFEILMPIDGFEEFVKEHGTMLGEYERFCGR